MPLPHGRAGEEDEGGVTDGYVTVKWVRSTAAPEQTCSVVSGLVQGLEKGLRSSTRTKG